MAFPRLSGTSAWRISERFLPNSAGVGGVAVPGWVPGHGGRTPAGTQAPMGKETLLRAQGKQSLGSSLFVLGA